MYKIFLLILDNLVDKLVFVCLYLKKHLQKNCIWGYQCQRFQQMSKFGKVIKAFDLLVYRFPQV